MSSSTRGQKVRLDDVRKLDDALAELPEMQNQEIAKTEAIRILLPRIQTLLKRGYSIPDIAKRLSDGGVPMTAMLLRTYLMREGGTSGRRRSKPKKRADAPDITAAQTVVPETGTSEQAQSVSMSTPSAGNIKQVPPADEGIAKSTKATDKPATPAAQPVAPKPDPTTQPSTSGESEEKPAPGKFTFKPDSKDL